jgi:hypothetical protein
VNLSERLRDVTFPADLVPPPHLADTVLRKASRRRLAFFGAVAAVLAPVLFVGAPSLVGSGGPGPGPVPPGGGPQVVHAYNRTGKTSVLDPASGKYRELPFMAVLSPDLTRVAVNDDGRLGIVDRAAVAAESEYDVEWLDVPAGNGPHWSPDGTALLWTVIGKEPTVHFTAYRVDLADRHVTQTPVPQDMLSSTIGWAADSRRYLVLLRGAETADTVEPGPLQYLSPDGTLGARLEGPDGMVYGATSYSPSRRYLLTDAYPIMTGKPVASPVLDVDTGKVVATVPPGRWPVGWYDDTTVARLTRSADGSTVVELQDIVSGAVIRSVRLPGSAGVSTVQLGSSAGLTGAAAALSF